MQSIRDIAFFKGVDDIDLARFQRHCGWRKVDVGQTVVDFDDLSDDVYFIMAGKARVQVRTAGGREVILADVGSGEFFGELAAIDGVPRSANVTALTKAEVCIVRASVLREMLSASPMLSMKMMQLLTSRVRELNAKLVERAVLDVRHSLYAELLRLSSPRRHAAPARIVSPPPFHHVLAARIGCRREQITRELGAMQREGLLEKARGAFVLPDPDTIRQRIDSMLNESG